MSKQYFQLSQRSGCCSGLTLLYSHGLWQREETLTPARMDEPVRDEPVRIEESKLAVGRGEGGPPSMGSYLSPILNSEDTVLDGCRQAVEIKQGAGTVPASLSPWPAEL